MNFERKNGLLKISHNTRFGKQKMKYLPRTSPYPNFEDRDEEKQRIIRLTEEIQKLRAKIKMLGG
jgi:hypothetical protein